jgi:uncharacterized protein (DUF58 family)
VKITGNIYLNSRFFAIGGFGAALFFLSYGFSWLFIPAIVTEALLAGLTIVDIMLLFQQKATVTGKRETNPIWSLGSNNLVTIRVVNSSTSAFNIRIVDELPEQFQNRNNSSDIHLEPNSEETLSFRYRPETRGEYLFGKTWAFLTTRLKLVERRIAIANNDYVQVVPSIEQMKKLELTNFTRSSSSQGIKLIRRIGNTQEFEQIKTYAVGDDQKRINWKATGKKAEIMVNQFQDERSQQIYCVIDKSRSMDFVSNGLSLLDHSINAALVLSNIALQKQDKAGLISYSARPETFVKADRKSDQLKVILDKLYKEKESHAESNLELLYYLIRRNITQRSLLVLFTNFESPFAVERALPVLRKLNTSHVVIVVFFENEELRDFSTAEPHDLEGVYDQILAEKYLYDKKQIQLRLKNYGIHAIVTRPEFLAVNAINKYLELKSRGVI